MSDIQKYNKDRKEKDSEFAMCYDEGLNELKVTVVLKDLLDEITVDNIQSEIDFGYSEGNEFW